MTALASYLPPAGHWSVAAGVVLGGLVGWVGHPALWVIAGPARWVGILLGTCQAESQCGTYDLGDLGASVGPLQWNRINAGLVYSVTDGDWRTSPYWSGYAAARYYSRRVIENPVGALAARVPVLAPIVLRWMYRDQRTLTRALWAEARAQYTTESASWASIGRPVHPLAVHMWGAAAFVVGLPIALLVLGVASPIALLVLALGATVPIALAVVRS